MNPVQIQTLQKKQSFGAQLIRKIKAQSPETERGVLVLLHIRRRQPWEEKMGLLMLLLVVMAASSHLERTGINSPDCSWMLRYIYSDQLCTLC